MQSTAIAMKDGSEATYVKGSYHVLYEGVAYFNCDAERFEPHVFSATSIGEKAVDGLRIQSGKSVAVLAKAKTIILPVKGSSSETVSFLEGGFEIIYNSDVYVCVDNRAVPRLSAGSIVSLEDAAVCVFDAFGQNRRFEKRSERVLGKRKMLDASVCARHAEAEKRVAILQRDAAKVYEVASRALEAVRELVALEEAACDEAGASRGMFEDYNLPLSGAEEALAAVVARAGSI